MAILLAGGSCLVTGSSRLAASFGVSELSIGLTVVAFGTSAPELAVNVLAAAEGDSSIAFGNVVGSNIANAALVLGVSALLRPIVVESLVVAREIPTMILATGVVVALGFDRLWGKAESYTRLDGGVLLLLFALFLGYSVTTVLAGRSQRDELAVAMAARPPRPLSKTLRAGALALLGLVLLVLGAHLTVVHAISLAEALAVPRVVIGLSIVAVGTSLPELATSLVAAWRGQASLAVGNIVGSNVFNLLFVLGTTSLIRPVEVPEDAGATDLLALTLLSLTLLVLSQRQGSRIGRPAGFALVITYVGYLTWRFLNGAPAAV